MSVTGAPSPSLGLVEFFRLRAIVNEKAGLLFGEEAQSVFERRLAERLSQRGLQTFSEYVRAVEEDPDELDALFGQITTKETYFFRQELQLKAFVEELLPQLAQRHVSHRRLTLWSAGCSSGEEAYTLAMLLVDSGLFKGWFLRVLGTDLCRQNIEAANRGVYRPSSFRTTGARWLQEYFVELPDGSYKVGELLRRMCHFSVANLVDVEALRAVGRVDVVFCRNVVIYLDDASRRAVFANIHQRLVPGGHLFLGHSESLLNTETPFLPVQLKGDLAYRRPDLALPSTRPR